MVKINSQKYFCLFACCIPVIGFKQSTFCDIQRNNYLVLPNEIVDIIIHNKEEQLSVEELSNEYGDVISQWLDRIVEEEYGFYVNTKEELALFPEISLDYFEPNAISNSIIDFDINSKHNLKKIVKELSILHCEAVEMRYFHSPSLYKLRNDIAYFQNSTIRSIELLIRFNPKYDIDEYKKIFEFSARIKKITIHNAGFDNIFIEDDTQFVLCSDVINSEAHCGVVEIDYFVANLPLFKEAKHHNSCLHKKVSIDKNGAIKNCPSSPESFGNIKDASILQVVYSRDFQKLWNITKEQIDVCKDCEFRLMCQDCRMYTTNADNTYSKPLKCNYDPYQAIWR